MKKVGTDIVFLSPLDGDMFITTLPSFRSCVITSYTDCTVNVNEVSTLGPSENVYSKSG